MSPAAVCFGLEEDLRLDSLSELIFASSLTLQSACSTRYAY